MEKARCITNPDIVASAVAGRTNRYDARGFVISETMSQRECAALLAGERVGRLGLSIGALPAILPVNYLLVGDAIVFRASGHSELFRASIGSVVAFEADGYDTGRGFGWSVLVRGMAVEVSDPTEIAIARAGWQEAWSLVDRADRLVEVPISIISGWRFTRAEADERH
jgi:uncharacterized protein